MQTTSHILMIRPVAFGLNQQTAQSNAFQNTDAPQHNTQELALEEFDGFVKKLKAYEVDVTVIEDTPEPHTPDSIFPNNWVSFHDDGTVVLYPMEAENRRWERRTDILDEIKKHFNINKIIDLSYFEEQELFLEGTGSMILDRINKITYACLSSRTNPKVLQKFCEEMEYQAVTFHSEDENGLAIYHTNVMMCIGDNFAVVCLDVVRDSSEQQLLVQSLQNSGKEIVEISIKQMKRFAGNMLLLKNKLNKNILVMSEAAFESLNASQIEKLDKHVSFLYSPLKTIETNGGGSARCMIAEIHLPVNK